MKKLFLDTNIILDLLANRNPYYESIAKIATLADQKKLHLIASPISFTTVNYILSKLESMETVMSKMRKFAIICQVCDVNQEIIEKSLNSKFSDFEDAVQYFSALNSGSNVIITRNGKDFKESQISIMTAEEYLKSIAN
ncbi:MAG: PIN domain-containing protein [Bacteroidia bacterium]|nr:PIN domain-containing protein [Bacteroidia bacterium]MCF8446667.1 PIN domain-containing protein [Bacteroidia bacterium]